MTSPKPEIVAIGDAIVDVIATCDERFLEERGLQKGSMRLLTPDEADRLYADMGPTRETSGGSAANTMAGVAALGGSAAFIGQIAADQLGTIFAHDMTTLGVRFDTPPISEGPPTGRCLILVTPDAQRTMNTCPGASHELSAAALDERLIGGASVLLLEGYLWGPERPRATMLQGIDIARQSGCKVAFTLSESICIAGRRDGFLNMIEQGSIDILFANEDEALQLTARADLDGALDELSAKVPTLVVTRGAAGAVGVEQGARTAVPAVQVERVVDTTGAGDLFAAGFLTARCRGQSIERCLGAGARAAAEVITHFGARPGADLSKLVDQ
ncbi:MAG TPA: adenosine kinase [Sphingomicrobium sp.]|nr:adenosine kinase [Sphingomicrobium sp.]